MSDVPSYATPAAPLARPRLSAASLTSMILGILFCIPVITSLAAVICGIVGFRAMRDGARSGRGFAIAGLTLGIIGLLGWTVIGIFVGFLVAASAAPRAVLHDFAGNLTSGNTAAAFAQSDPPITQADLEKLHDDIVPFGTYTDLTCTGTNIRGTSAGEACELYGQAYFSSKPHPFNALLVKNAAGVWKVRGFHIY